jgi:hypothetical protein
MAKTGLFGISLSTGGGGGAITITQAPQTPSTQNISGVAGATVATWKSFTFVIYSGTVDIGGTTFRSGTYTFNNGGGTLGSIAYDATLSGDAKLLIQQ